MQVTSYLNHLTISFFLPQYKNPYTRHVKHFKTTRRPADPPPPLPPPAPPPSSPQAGNNQAVENSGGALLDPNPPTNPTSDLANHPLTSTDTATLDLLQETEAKSLPTTKSSGGGATKASKAQSHTCGECGKAFLTAFQLNKHRLGHSHNNCDKCDAKFAKRRLLVHHLKTVHYIATAEKYYACNFCSRKFVKKPSLWGHLAEHTSGEQVKSLPICCSY